MGLGRGNGVGVVVVGVMAHCWALRHQAQMNLDGFVMAGWFLGVCHVDSGREHQPAPDLCRSFVGRGRVRVSGCAIVVFCVFVLFVECLFGKH